MNCHTSTPKFYVSKANTGSVLLENSWITLTDGGRQKFSTMVIASLAVEECMLIQSLDLPIYAQEHIRYGASNALPLSKGEILRHHLDAARRGDESADRWFAMLDRHTRGRIRQLKKDGELLKCFQALLGFSGLWPDFKLGPLNRELPMRCREVGISLCEADPI